MGIGGVLCLTRLFVAFLRENIVGTMSVISIVADLEIFAWELRWNA